MRGFAHTGKQEEDGASHRDEGRNRDSKDSLLLFSLLPLLPSVSLPPLPFFPLSPPFSSVHRSVHGTVMTFDLSFTHSFLLTQTQKQTSLADDQRGTDEQSQPFFTERTRKRSKRQMRIKGGE